MKSPAPRPSPFTLIELLVVVAIIAILASLLLPSLSRAREKGRAAVCASNLHQVGTFFAFHADTYDGWLPTANTTWDLGNGDKIYSVWYTFIVNMSFPQDIRQCPSDNTRKPGSTWPWPGPDSGEGWYRYGWENPTYSPGYAAAYELGQYINASTGWWQGYAIRRLSSLETPTIDRLANDAELQGYGTMAASKIAWTSWIAPSVGFGSPYLHWERHDGRLNFLFADGHTGAMSVSEFEAYFKTQNQRDM